MGQLVCNALGISEQITVRDDWAVIELDDGLIRVLFDAVKKDSVNTLERLWCARVYRSLRYYANDCYHKGRKDQTLLIAHSFGTPTAGDSRHGAALLQWRYIICALFPSRQREGIELYSGGVVKHP